MWELVELRELRVFLTLYEELHFGRAAQRLRLSQTRVSQTIQELETKLGTPLYTRTSRRVAPTPAGDQLHGQARSFYEQLRRVLREIHEVNREIAGALRLGLDGPSSGGQALPEIISLFSARHPDCTIQVTETGIGDPTAPSAAANSTSSLSTYQSTNPTSSSGQYSAATHGSSGLRLNIRSPSAKASSSRTSPTTRHTTAAATNPRKDRRLVAPTRAQRPADPPPPPQQPQLQPDLRARRRRRNRPLRLQPTLPHLPRRYLQTDHRHASNRIRPRLACQQGNRRRPGLRSSHTRHPRQPLRLRQPRLDGLSVDGLVDGHAVVAGRPSLLNEWGVELPAELDGAVQEAQSRGQTAIAAAWDGAPRAVFVVADAIKPTSFEAVARFKELGLHPVLLTGDNQATAQAVAAEVRIEEVIAEVLPSQKAEVVARLQAEGRVVAMVGDGVNDAPALAQADLGLAIGTGTDVAIEASDLTIVNGRLTGAADAIQLSRRTLRTIKGNLFWAFAYNVAALPLAAAGRLNPLIAGAVIAFSSLFVVSNSLRLRRFGPDAGNRAAAVDP